MYKFSLSGKVLNRLSWVLNVSGRNSLLGRDNILFVNSTKAAKLVFNDIVCFLFYLLITLCYQRFPEYTIQIIYLHRLGYMDFDTSLGKYKELKWVFVDSQVMLALLKLWSLFLRCCLFWEKTFCCGGGGGRVLLTKQNNKTTFFHPTAPHLILSARSWTSEKSA